jgi:hypothetical protein
MQMEMVNVTAMIHQGRPLVVIAMYLFKWCENASHGVAQVAIRSQIACQGTGVVSVHVGNVLIVYIYLQRPFQICGCLVESTSLRMITPVIKLSRIQPCHTSGTPFVHAVSKIVLVPATCSQPQPSPTLPTRPALVCSTREQRRPATMSSTIPSSTAPASQGCRKTLPNMKPFEIRSLLTMPWRRRSFPAIPSC